MEESAIGWPPKRRRLEFSSTICCFCSKQFEDSKTELNPHKFDTLLKICNTRSDEISQKIVSNEAAIRSGELKLFYHKTCRTKFLYQIKKNEDTLVLQEMTAFSAKFTRSQQTYSDFDWKRDCFICGEKCSVKHKSKWSQIEGSIDETSKLYQQLLEISKLKNDSELHNRLLSSNGDLVAQEARYHRKKGCLAKLLSHMYSKFKEFFEKHNTENGSIPSTRQVKKALQSVWPEVKFIHRKGLSDLVCSADINVEDALPKLVDLEKSFDSLKEEEHDADALLSRLFSDHSDERSVIHQAAGILRERILKMDGLKKEYFSANELSLNAQKDFLDPLLLSFVCWLSGIEDDKDTHTEITQKLVAVCSDLTTVYCHSQALGTHSLPTPFVRK